MDAYQPTLWDNIALEKGYGLLSGLQLKEAITQFKDAMQSPMADLESIQGVITCCEFWQGWLGMLSGGPEMDDPGEQVARSLQEILEDYRAYPFDSRMTGFKKNLLGRLTDHFQDKGPLDLKTFESLFDLLLGLNMYPRAMDLASHAVHQGPQEYFLHYFLAQAQWLNKDQSEAKRNYAMALLYFPDGTMQKRIVHGQLGKLVEDQGMAMGAAFGRLYEILPPIPIKDGIRFRDQEHQNATECYQLLEGLSKTMLDGDQRANVQFRKQLKERAPDLFDAYMRRLHLWK